MIKCMADVPRVAQGKKDTASLPTCRINHPCCIILQLPTSVGVIEAGEALSEVVAWLLFWRAAPGDLAARFSAFEAEPGSFHSWQLGGK